MQVNLSHFDPTLALLIVPNTYILLLSKSILCCKLPNSFINGNVLESQLLLTPRLIQLCILSLKLKYFLYLAIAKEYPKEVFKPETHLSFPNRKHTPYK